MPTFKEISESLDKALTDVAAKKVTLDKIAVDHSQAYENYNASVNTAMNLKAQLNSALSEVLPASDERARVSG